MNTHVQERERKRERERARERAWVLRKKARQIDETIDRYMDA